MSSIDSAETIGNNQDQQPDPAAKQKQRRRKLFDPDDAAALRQEEWEQQQAPAEEAEHVDADDRPKIMARSRDRRAFGLCMTELGYAFRRNTRSLGLEVSIDGGPWTAVEDDFVHWLRSEFPLKVLITTSVQQGPRRWEIGPEQFNSWLEALGYINRADPFTEYGMRAAQNWDGRSRNGSVLQEVFGAEDTPITRAANYLIFELAADRSLHPGKPSKEIPVLTGPQQIGKTPFLRELTPNPLSQFGTVSMKVDPKRRLEATDGKVIVELAEMTGVKNPAFLDVNKSYLSEVADNGIRRAFARRTTQSPRCFVFVGTTNDRTPLPNDPSGNTRYVVIECPRGSNVELYMAENRDQIWGEAWHRVLAGFNPQFPRELHAARDEANETYRDSDVVLEEALREMEVKLARNDPEQLRMGMTSSDICWKLTGGLLSTTTRLDTAPTGRRLANALEARGWTQDRKAAARLWKLLGPPDSCSAQA